MIARCDVRQRTHLGRAEKAARDEFSARDVGAAEEGFAARPVDAHLLRIGGGDAPAHAAQEAPGSQATGQRNMPSPLDEQKKPKDFKPVEPGSYTSAAIIMLTDGARTTGPDPLEAAKMAADRGVRVYTVGIGTVAGETIGFEGWSMRVRLDEAALKQVAALTAAEYFYAGTAQDLLKVYQSLSSKLVVEKKETEITAFFAAAGALLALLSAGLSVWWFGRVA